MRYYRRFDPTQRIMHFFVVVSFLGLAVTGLPLKFAAQGWAQGMAQMLGGFQALGWFHRLCGLVTLGYFVVHILLVINELRKTPRSGWMQFFLGPDSMVPNLGDLRQMISHMLWFAGLGRRPRFERWTYWEKFDYWAVWWGVLIIGSSGLVLWFPTWFSGFMPGWLFNVAMIIHSDEALLATGFIFTIHFFNGHLRPGKFPMDTAVFTGAASEEELEEDHPAWMERLRGSGALESMTEPQPSADFLFVARAFGFLAVAVGLAMVLMMIATSLFH